MLTAEADLTQAMRLLADLGFWLDSPFPAHAGDSRLSVALRDRPTFHHFDPERVTFWETGGGRGHPAELTRDTPMPLDGEFSWGKVAVIDRLGVNNEFVALGGTLHAAATTADTTIAVFRSPGPILRLGGHSQGPDLVATDLGAFFGRIMVPIDFRPGMEEAISAATPMQRYAAFIAHERRRFADHPLLRDEHPQTAAILVDEARRLERDEPFAWAAGNRLLERLGVDAPTG